MYTPRLCNGMKTRYDLDIRIKLLRFQFIKAVVLLSKDFEEYVCFFSGPK